MLPTVLRKIVSKDAVAAPVVATPALPNKGALPAPLQKIVMSREDQEFLPAALEILETPPSPVKMAIIHVMAAFVVVSLVWSFFGRLDVIAIAQGKVQPPGRVKVVQPVEAGKVLRIAVQNGDRVTKDAILVEFDPIDARADRESLEASVSALRAEIVRRDTVIRNIHPQQGVLSASPPILWPTGIPEGTRRREIEVMTADLSQLSSVLSSLDAQRVQKRRENQRLLETIAAQETLVSTLKERVTMRNTLATSGYGTRSSLIDSKETLQKEQTALATYKGQLTESDAALDVLDRERSRQLQVFTADNTQKRSDAQKLLDEASQKLAKAISRFDNLTLRAPSEGIVQASSIYTVGQVVGAGQEIMRIVPENGELEVEAYLANKDIGFVREGQEVSVKVDSFPFTRYGMLIGRVRRVARDAIPQSEASQIEGNPSRPGESQMFGGAQRMQNLVFPVTISLDKRHLSIEGQQVPVTPGMTVTTEIKTGSRRILEYLFSPIVETTSEAMRER